MSNSIFWVQKEPNPIAMCKDPTDVNGILEFLFRKDLPNSMTLIVDIHQYYFQNDLERNQWALGFKLGTTLQKNGRV